MFAIPRWSGVPPNGRRRESGPLSMRPWTGSIWALTIRKVSSAHHHFAAPLAVVENRTGKSACATKTSLGGVRIECVVSGFRGNHKPCACGTRQGQTRTDEHYRSESKDKCM